MDAKRSKLMRATQPVRNSSQGFALLLQSGLFPERFMTEVAGMLVPRKLFVRVQLRSGSFVRFGEKDRLEIESGTIARDVYPAVTAAFKDCAVALYSDDAFSKHVGPADIIQPGVLYATVRDFSRLKLSRTIACVDEDQEDVEDYELDDTNHFHHLSISPNGEVLCGVPSLWKNMDCEQGVALLCNTDGSMMKTILDTSEVYDNIIGVKISSVCFAGKGSKVAMGLSNGEIVIYNICTNGHFIIRNQSHRNPYGHGTESFMAEINCLASSKSGILASAGTDRIIKLWQEKSDRSWYCLSTLGSSSLSCPPNYPFPEIWSPLDARNNPLRDGGGHIMEILGVDFAKDESKLASVSGRSLRIWDVNEGRLLKTQVVFGGLISCAWNPSGSMIAVLVFDRVSILDTSTFHCIQLLQMPKRMCLDRWYLDEKVLYYIQWQTDECVLIALKNISLWSVGAGVCVKDLGANDHNATAMSKDGQLIAIGRNNLQIDIYEKTLQ